MRVVRDRNLGVLPRGGYNRRMLRKIDADIVSHPQFKIAREERDVDAELQHQLLVLSMLSLKMFRRRSHFVEGCNDLGVSNRVFTILHRSAFRPEKYGDPGSGVGAGGRRSRWYGPPDDTADAGDLEGILRRRPGITE